MHFLQLIRPFLLVFSLLVFIPCQALAGEINKLTVTESTGIYHIFVSADIDASEPYVRQVITDYLYAYRINSSIIESEVLESPIPGNIRVRAKLLLCMPLFCREAERVDEVSTLESGDILAVIVPELSDFYSGKALWKIIPNDHTTRLVYLASIEPGFFIPPVIGSGMVIKSMREQFRKTFQRIEQVARIKEEREWDEAYDVSALATQIDYLPCETVFNTEPQ